MKQFKVYRLRFSSPLHVNSPRGDASVSMKTIHSDTFHAALIACLAKEGEKIPDDGDLGCTMSCLFPYYQRSKESKPIYFMPFPLQSRLPNLHERDRSLAKTVKKVKWVDSSLYPALLQGERFFDSENNKLEWIFGNYLLNIHDEKYCLPRTEDGTIVFREFVCSEVIQRASIKDRNGHSDAVPFYMDRITFRQQSGLYFLAIGDTAMLDKAISLLEKEGIGTDRNVGFGFFEKEVDQLSIETPDVADHVVTLSMFIPEDPNQLKQLMASDKVAYDFARRGGWISGTTMRKNAVYGFLPGSVFNKPDGIKDSIGHIVDLKPGSTPQDIGHSVWRNGRTIVLPIKLQ